MAPNMRIKVAGKKEKGKTIASSAQIDAPQDLINIVGSFPPCPRTSFAALENNFYPISKNVLHEHFHRLFTVLYTLDKMVFWFLISKVGYFV